MNMMKLRQILEMRRATKAPPLIPPRTKRGSDGDTKKGPKELIDVHLNLRNFQPGPKSKSDSIVLIFSESEDSEQGWKATTSSDLLQKAEQYDLNTVFTLEFQFERCQYIKIDVCDWREYTAISLGYTVFAVSELVTQRDGAIIRDVVDDELGQTVANVLISSSLRPKPHSILLQFYARNLTTRKNIMTSAQVFFEVHQAQRSTNESKDGEGKERQDKVLYRSECTKYSSKVLFKTFSLQSTDLLNDPIEIACFYRDSKNPKVAIGSFQATYDQLSQPLLTQKQTYTLTYESSKRQKKVCGEFDLLKFNEMILPSFLEFISTGTVVNVAFAVDLTQSEQAVDAALIQQYVNDVELAIKAIGQPLGYFNATNSYAAFGFGAKIPPHFRESQEFCLNLETDPHCRGVDGVLDAFRTAFANTQPMNTAHLSHVIYYVSKLAQNASNRSKNSVYYVLIVITRGVFDDIKETVQALIFASRAPISVVFVGVGEMDLTELQRLGAAGTRLNFHGRKPERDCGQSVIVPKCREEEHNPVELGALIAERALSQIPWQLTTWMSRNGIKPNADQMPQALPHEMYASLEYSWQPMQPTPQTPSSYSMSETVDGSPAHSTLSGSLAGSEDRSASDRPPSRRSTESSSGASGSQKQRQLGRQHAFDHAHHQQHSGSATPSYQSKGYELSPAQHTNDAHYRQRKLSPHQQYAYEQQIAFEQCQQIDSEADSLHSIESVHSQRLNAVAYTPQQQSPRLRQFHRSESIQTPPHSHYAHQQQYPQRPASRQNGRY